jgi:hypothetical protein
MSLDLNRALQLALVGGAGFLVYKKFFADRADSADDQVDDVADDAVDEEDANEPDELAALNNPALKREGKKPVGPLTRKIRNKKRKIAMLRKLGDLGPKLAKLEAQVEELKRARLDKLIAKHGEAQVREMLNRKISDKMAAKMASARGIAGVPFVAAESITLTGGVGTTSQEAEEDAIVSQLMAVAELEPGSAA